MKETCLDAVKPAGNGAQQHVERRDVDHLRELTSQPDLALPTRSTETWDTTHSRSAK
jgi:hypothetical protein